MKHTGARALLVSALLFIGLVGRAAAFPMLQVAIQGGTYDNSLQEVVAAGPSFTLYVYLIAPTTALADTYYISAALTPQVFPPGGNFGSFSFGMNAPVVAPPPSLGTLVTTTSYIDTNSGNATPDGTKVDVPAGSSTTVLATQDMVYGDAPLERYQNDTASFDPGDLSPHGIYDTYFREFSFRFNPFQRSTAFDVVANPGQGPIANPAGTMYYQAFTVNTASLSSAYQVHFDVYSETGTGAPGSDVDVKSFAPFSHTGRSDPPITPIHGTPVPEPASMILLGSGLTALVVRRRRRAASRG